MFLAGDFDTADVAPADSAGIAQTVLDAPAEQYVDPAPAARPAAAGLRSVAAVPAELVAQSDLALEDDFDYGPGFVPYSQMSPADQARSDGYFLHHVQHQAVNDDNVLSFVKMISYPQ